MTQIIPEAPERLGQCVGTGRTAEVYLWGEAHVVKLFRTGSPAKKLGFSIEHDFSVGAFEPGKGG